MANKRIGTAEPMSVAAVQRRAARMDRNKSSRDSDFDALCLDTLVGIARGDTADPKVRRDDPVEVAREVMRVGERLFASEFGDPGTWCPWDRPEQEGERSGDG